MALFEEVKTNHNWFEKLRNVKSEDNLKKLLEERGFEFTDEFKEKLSVIKMENKAGLLNDNELEQVTGGVPEYWDYHDYD